MFGVVALPSASPSAAPVATAIVGARLITMRSAGNDKPETVPLFRQTRDGAFVAPRAYTSQATPFGHGTIRAGKAADLVLLAADPTLDINNTIKIHRVMRAGRWVQ